MLTSSSALLLGNAYPPLIASAAPATVSGSDSSSTVTSNSATISAVGGSGLRNYAWEYVSGSVAISAVSPASATSTFQATGMSVGSISAVFRGKVTDVVTGEVQYTATNVTVYLERGYPPLSAGVSGSGVKTQTSPGSITVTSDGVTGSGSGGIPPYTYHHQYLSGSSDFTINSPNSASTTHSRVLGPGGGVAGTVRMTVTDSIGQTAYADYGVVLINDGVAASNPTVSASPSSVMGLSPDPSIMTGATTATAAGGTPGYSYLWTRVSGVGDPTDPTSATTSFLAYVGAYTTMSGTFQCRVTDSLGNQATTLVSADFTRFDLNFN